MRTIPAGQFKARCLALMDEVQAKREPIVITKKGVAVARLVPADDKPRDIFGCAAGTARIMGDLTEPLIAPEEWKALASSPRQRGPRD